MSDSTVSVDNQHNGTIVLKENEPSRQNILEGIRLRCLETAAKDARLIINDKDMDEATTSIIKRARRFEEYVINGTRPKRDS